MLEDVKKRMEHIERHKLFKDERLNAIHELYTELQELCEMVQFFAHPPEPDTLEPTALVQLTYDIQHKYGWASYRGTKGEHSA